MLEVVNNYIDYRCMICGEEIPNMPVLDESKSVLTPFHGQHLQILITGVVDHQCNMSNQTPDKPTDGLLENTEPPANA